MVKVFESKIVSVGPEAKNMIETTNMLILFGKEAPSDLAEYCFIIDNKELTGLINEGGYLLINDDEYLITAVGNVVNENLSNLGHITISFDGLKKANLPGTLHVVGDKKPVLNNGTKVQIIC